MELQRPEGSDVLIVEDLPDLRETLAELLRRAGYRTVTAANGPAALAHLRRAAPPLLILLDLRLPAMSGRAFRVEREQTPAPSAFPKIS